MVGSGRVKYHGIDLCKVKCYGVSMVGGVEGVYGSGVCINYDLYVFVSGRCP